MASMSDGFFSRNELVAMGFRALGDNVSISRRASIYGTENISIGSNVRIDDFCILSGTIAIGSYIHVAAYTSLCGGTAGICLRDFVNLSRKIEIFAVSDDFSGESMTNPMVPAEFKRITDAPVLLERHVLVGASSVILPGVCLAEGAVVGALSLVRNDLPAWTISAGIPARVIKSRSRQLLELEQELLSR